MVETEHLLLSILKNKENIATQILNQFDVDYDLFRTELGMVGSTPTNPINPPSAEFPDDAEDEFDEEKRGGSGFGASPKAKLLLRVNLKHQCLIILDEILPSLPKWIPWIQL